VTRSEQEKVRGMEWAATGGTLFKGGTVGRQRGSGGGQVARGTMR
jgi:hypothetical protein